MMAKVGTRNENMKLHIMKIKRISMKPSTDCSLHMTEVDIKGCKVDMFDEVFGLLFKNIG